MHIGPVNPLVPDFWVPVAQIVPVFALAIVLEARRSAGRWTYKDRLGRWVAGLYYLFVAICLVAVEALAFGAMVSGESSMTMVVLAFAALLMIIVLIVLGAAFEVTLSGFSDVLFVLARGFLWLVPSTRTNRKKLKDMRTHVVAQLAHLATMEVDTKQKVKDARASRREDREHVESIREQLADGNLSAAREAELIELLPRAVELVDESTQLLDSEKHLLRKNRELATEANG